MTRRALPALLALALLTACSSGGGTDAAESTPSPSTSALATTDTAPSPTPTPTPTPSPTPTPTASATATVMATPSVAAPEPTPSPVSSAPAITQIPRPDDAQQLVLIGALSSIDPQLVEKADKAVSNARNQCQKLLADAHGDPGSLTAIQTAKMRFDQAPLTDAQAQQVNAAILAGGWCK